MESLKHECGIAMIRLLRPLEYYKMKYGSYTWALNKLYLLMEKQHNRGQEAAGIGVVKLKARPGSEYVYRERELGKDAIQKIFDTLSLDLEKIKVEKLPPREVEEEAPFVGEIYMGHLRYSTTGKSGMSYVHPFLRRNNWRSRNLLLCGNFNMTNPSDIFNRVVENGQHPRIYSDTVILLEQLGYALDKENHRIYKEGRKVLQGHALTEYIEDNLNVENILEMCSPMWDGGFVICGATGSGDIFALRDAAGIRPAFYYLNDEFIVITSERPVIQTVFKVPFKDIRELEPGNIITVSKKGEVKIDRILEERLPEKCSFERIYFSRGSDAEIYRERKKLGHNLVPTILEAVDYNFRDTIFSFIPNTAEVAFIGMIEGLQAELDKRKCNEIERWCKEGCADSNILADIMRRHLRIEKIAIKDIKLRTFITEGDERNELASHVYDVTYGCVENYKDILVLIDDSIVRGTTLKQSIIKILDTLHPKEIIVVSSAPQVRYPDYYGIDMSSLSEFAAFRAAIELLKMEGRQNVIGEVYRKCKEMADLPDNLIKNCVKEIYENFTDSQISEQMAKMLVPENTKAKVKLIFQSLDGLHNAVPEHTGDWYFSGNYPTPGGIRLVNQAFINYFEGKKDR